MWIPRAALYACALTSSRMPSCQVEVFSADEVSEIFDAISYYKGASVIRQVFDWIGPEVSVGLFEQRDCNLPLVNLD